MTDTAYCPACDQPFPADDVRLLRVDAWGFRVACPLCGHVYPRLFLSDAYYDLGLYLLSVADEDAWPGDGVRLPRYEE